MAQSGNRPPRGGQSKSGGGNRSSNGANRPPRSDRTTPNGKPADSASERARERLAQQSLSGQKRQSASQRARAGGPSPQRGRSGGPSSRRGSSKSAPKHSTARTAGIFGTVLVVLAVLVIILVSVVSKPTTSAAAPDQVAPASVVNALYAPPAAFAAAGSAVTSGGPAAASLYTLKKLPILRSGGKPLIVYIGSEYCPYCAATRWPLAVALGRFGTFKGLHMTTSSSSDVYPKTPTLSFHDSTYTSKYIAFSATEECTNIASTSTSTAVLECSGYEPLETVSPANGKFFDKYDFPPYVPSTGNSPGGIPFVDFANQIHEDGAFILPTILAGFSHQGVAESLGNPTALPGQAILVAANYYSAIICKLTNNQPGSVCQMPVVKQAARALKL
jgi:hypothetical protein